MIGNHKYIDSNNILKIGELTPEDQFTLFTKILSQDSIFPMTPSKKKETQQFLEKLSPFPLDISTAAFYLKTTHLSYADYLKRIRQSDDSFNTMEEGVLKEVNDYIKTRYGIISLSIQSLIHNNQDFIEVLLLISLLDSQDIPRDLLSYHKDPLTADKLFYHLKKSSLVSEKLSSSGRTFSLHRNTQALILIYLTRMLELKKNPSLIEQVVIVVENYSEHLREKGNTLEMKRFIPHMTHLRDSAKAISKTLMASLNDKLGLLYFSTRLDYLKAKELLEESLKTYQEHYKTPLPKTAMALLTLGRIHHALGHYEDEKKFIEQSFELYKKCYPDEDSVEMVELFIHLGNLYKRSGDYIKARKFLEKSYWIYKNHYGETSINTVRVLGVLGRFYRCIGDFKKAQKLLESSLTNYNKYYSESLLEIALLKISLGRVYKSLENYAKAKQFIEEGLSFYKQHLGDNHIDIAWEQMHLASAYGRLGNWRIAKQMIEKNLIIIKKHYGTVSPVHIWALKKLGSTHRKLGEYDKALQILEQSLSLCQKHYDDQEHVEIVAILSQLGKTYFLKGDFKKAEAFLCKALEILKKKDYPKTYGVLGALVELYLKRLTQEKIQGNKLQEQLYKNKAKQCIEELITTIKLYFPEDSSYVRRIEAQQRLIEKE
jgi:tetratricopeptide (TPR) repeat protein